MGANDDLEKGNKLLKDQAVEAGYVDNAYKSIAATLSNMFEDVIDNLNGIDAVGGKIAKSYERDIVGSIKKMSSGLEKGIEIQDKINKGQNVSKEIESKLATLKTRALLTSQKISQSEGLSTEAKLKLRAALKEQYILETNNLNSLKAQNEETQKNKSFTQSIGENLQGWANNLDETGALASILKGDFNSIAGTTKALELVFGLLAKATLQANKSVTNIQKELGVGTLTATQYRLQIAGAAFSANDLRITTEGLIKANSTLNSSYQTAAIFNEDILKGATSILDAQVMSEGATSQLAGDAARLGMTFDQSLKTQENAVNAVNSQTGAQISLKAVLEASNKVSGQIRAQLGANPEAIARAVTHAKALGFELDQIASAGKSMLDFESSISAELEAELLTGKQLNLEKARLAALTGDYETLTSEIVNNVGDWNSFQDMNVLQQDAIAKSVGMTADQLANSLITEENRSQLLADAIASGDKQRVSELKALDTQEKFAKVMLQIKGLFIDIATIFSPIADLVGLIADGLGTWVGKLGAVITAFIIMRKLSIGTAITKLFSAASWAGPAAPIVGLASVLAMMGAVSQYSKKMDDGTISPEGLVVNSPKGSINLNKDDSIIAGTNLGGGGNTQPAPMTPIIVKSVTQFDSFSANNPNSSDGRLTSYGNHETSFV